MKNPAENLLPMIRSLKADALRFKPCWPEPDRSEDSERAYFNRVIEDVDKGRVADYARLTASFARAVQTAARNDVNIAYPDLDRDAFERDLIGESDTLTSLFETMDGIVPADRPWPARLDQKQLLADTQNQLLDAISAFRNIRISNPKPPAPIGFLSGGK